MSDDNFVTILSQHKLKTTQARISLLELVEKENKPVDSQFLIDSLKKDLKVDKVTIFRILNILTEHGILRKLEFGEGKARYELMTEDHHHFICEKCGHIEDISDCNIEIIEKEITKKKGLLIKKHSLEFFGLCKSCQL